MEYAKWAKAAGHTGHWLLATQTQNDTKFWFLLPQEIACDRKKRQQAPPRQQHTTTDDRRTPTDPFTGHLGPGSPGGRLLEVDFPGHWWPPRAIAPRTSGGGGTSARVIARNVDLRFASRIFGQIFDQLGTEWRTETPKEKRMLRPHGSISCGSPEPVGSSSSAASRLCRHQRLSLTHKPRRGVVRARPWELQLL
jgi:hypothetical protein